MIKAVIFDLDDTLISEEEYIRSGFKVVADKISSDYRKNSDDIYRMLSSEFEVNSKNVFNRSLDRLKLNYDNDYILELINIYRGHKPDIKLYEDAESIINELYKKGIKLGIITDGYAITQRSKLKTLEIYKYFDYIIITDELGRDYWKPNKKSYEMMKEKLGVEYKNMIYVGDNVSKDFITANKLGIYTICICRNEGIYSNLQVYGQYNAKKEIKSLEDIKHILYNVGESINEKNIICDYS